MPTHHQDFDHAAIKIVESVGHHIVLGVPLGLGKPVGFINALYRLAESDSSIQLTIITGLTLARPKIKGELASRFITPILDRVMQDYEEPLYEDARLKQILPANITIIEFFLTPGKFLHNNYVQQNYISSKYTSVAQDSLRHGLNVVAQQVAYQAEHKRLSLSSNTDLFRDVYAHLKKQAARENSKFAIVAEVNQHLPFMYEDAIVDESIFTDIINSKRERALFALPREEISKEEHLIGLYSSLLVPDDGCLQIGIGKLGNAIAHALIMRHEQNDLYQTLLHKLAGQKFADAITPIQTLKPFQKGLYASTEMMSDEYLQLYLKGIVKKNVYDHIGLQRLLNEKNLTVVISEEWIDALLAAHIIHPVLTQDDIKFMQHFGILKADLQFIDGQICTTSGEKFSADLTDHDQKTKFIQHCLGSTLLHGHVIHAAFFLGSNDFYQALKTLPVSQLKTINMSAVERTNSLLLNPELFTLQRKNARLINTAMMITCGGSSISDGLRNLQEVSGVGGQFDFVLMAHQLPDARAIITCRSTRKTKRGVASNIVWDYPNATIPRFLRDIFVTEYGIADCRGKKDSDVIKAILNICDSRFQERLLKCAKASGKIEASYCIPDAFRNNLPENLQTIFNDQQLKNYFKPYPFGTDLTKDEEVLKTALLILKRSSKTKLTLFIIQALFYRRKDLHTTILLERMQLQKPGNIKEYLYKKLLTLILEKHIKQ